MCYCNCPHEDINGCCREDECTFVKNGMTPPKVLMCPFGGGCITYLCPFSEDCSVYKCTAQRWFDPKIKNEGYCGLAVKEGTE